MLALKFCRMRHLLELLIFKILVLSHGEDPETGELQQPSQNKEQAILDYRKILKFHLFGEINLSTCKILKLVIKDLEENMEDYMSEKIVFDLRSLKLFCKKLEIGDNEYIHNYSSFIRNVISMLAYSDSFWEMVQAGENFLSRMKLDCRKYINHSALEDARYLRNRSISYESQLNVTTSPISEQYKSIYKELKPSYKINLEKVLVKCLQENAEDPLTEPVIPYFSKNDRPVVHIAIMLQSLLTLKNDGQLNFYAYFEFIWRDPRRTWAIEKEYPFPKQVFLAPSEIWHPKLFVSKCTSDDCDIGPDNETRISLYFNGNVKYGVWKKIETICMINLNNFPVDSQKCEAEFLSAVPMKMFLVSNAIATTELYGEEWVLTGSQAYSSNYSYQMVEKRPKSDLHWLALQSKQVGINVEDNLLFNVLTEGTRERESLIVELSLSRNSMYYGITIIIPAFILTIMGVSSIFIPIDEEDKLEIIAMALLGFVFLQGILADVMPKSNTWPILGIYFSVAIPLTAFYFAGCCISIYLSPKKKDPEETQENVEKPKAASTKVREQESTKSKKQSYTKITNQASTSYRKPAYSKPASTLEVSQPPETIELNPLSTDSQPLQAEEAASDEGAQPEAKHQSYLLIIYWQKIYKRLRSCAKWIAKQFQIIYVALVVASILGVIWYLLINKCIEALQT